MKVYHGRLLLIIALGLILFPSTLSAQKDHFKAYLKAPGHEIPTRLQGNKIHLGNNGKDLYLVGELKAADPDFSNQAFVIHADAEGETLQTFSLKSNIQNATDGVRGASISIDTDDNIYVGGGYTGSWSPLGIGAERTLTSMDATGKLNWSAMQSSFYYVDLSFNYPKNQVLALSGPNNLANTNYNIQFSEFDSDGKIASTFALETPFQDYGRAIVSTTNGIAFAGTSYQGTEARALVAFTDFDLNLNWAFILSNNDLTLDVQDLAYHKEGVLALSGTATDAKDASTQAFIIGIGVDGETRFFHTYSTSNTSESEGKGIQAYTHGDDQGFLLTGFYHEKNDQERKSLILNIDIEGNIQWINSYSPFKPEDNTYDEVLRDIIYVESEAQFVAVGDISRYKNGQSIDKKAIVLVKGPILDGQLRFGEDCYQVITASASSLVLGKESVGVGKIEGGSVLGFSYQQPPLEFNTGYCSFGPSGKIGLDDPDGTPTSRFVSNEYFQVLKTGMNSIRIENKLSTNNRSLQIEIFNLQGQRMSEARLAPMQTTLDMQVPGTAYGMYFLSIKNNNSLLAVKRFILGQ